MASVQHPAPNYWVVHLASRSASDSEVTVELRMSKTTADNLANLQAARIAATSPAANSPMEDVGSAVLTLLTSTAAIARVKERASASDQQELIDVIDTEVDAVRADRP